ncbi:unnamed protein product [Phytomonas sp. EM1]|nr:unnamed protein product [Phytomonas sp. EM1]|eukprot:CCW59769.1 unnamed protein product [Phytomonas sp. isolate EM1]
MNFQLEALRMKLLLELSELRAQCEDLAAQRDDSLNVSRSFSQESSSCLDQNDRDAIEAFFNSEDDFITRFNSGAGELKRGVFFEEAS